MHTRESIAFFLRYHVCRSKLRYPQRTSLVSSMKEQPYMYILKPVKVIHRQKPNKILSLTKNHQLTSVYVLYNHFA